MRYVENLKEIISKLDHLQTSYEDVNGKCQGQIPIIFVRCVDDRQAIFQLDLDTSILTGVPNSNTDYLNSWRGDYSELSINMDSSESKDVDRVLSNTRKFLNGEDVFNILTVKKLSNKLSDIIGTTMYGYKGGEFRITEKSSLWVDKYGVCSVTPIRVGFIDVINIEEGSVCVLGCVNENIHLKIMEEEIMKKINSEVIDIFNKPSEVREVKKEDGLSEEVRDYRDLLRSIVTETFESSWYKNYYDLYLERFRYASKRESSTPLSMCTNVRENGYELGMAVSDLSSFEIPCSYNSLTGLQIPAVDVGAKILTPTFSNEGKFFDLPSECFTSGVLGYEPDHGSLVYGKYKIMMPMAILDDVMLYLNFKFLDSLDDYVNELNKELNDRLNGGESLETLATEFATDFNSKLLSSLEFRIVLNDSTGINQKYYQDTLLGGNGVMKFEVLKIIDEIMYSCFSRLQPSSTEIRPMFEKSNYITMHNVRDAELMFGVKFMGKLSKCCWY